MSGVEKVYEGALNIVPVRITTSGNTLSLQQLTVYDSKEMFDLIDRNRRHLSQHGEPTARNYPNIQRARESILRPSVSNRLRFAIRNKVGEFVGSISITPKNRYKVAEIGYYLGKEFTGYGYATQAVQLITKYGFDALGYEEIEAYIHCDNTASEKVVKSAGYNLTHTLGETRRFVKRFDESATK